LSQHVSVNVKPSSGSHIQCLAKLHIWCQCACRYWCQCYGGVFWPVVRVYCAPWRRILSV